MTLIVETGSGSATAESYCTVSYFLTYHAARLNTDAALMTTEEIEASLRKATDFMIQRYRNLWRGFKVHTTQALDWPRNGIIIDEFVTVDYTIVPVEIKNACCILALKAATNELLSDTEQQVLSETIGPMSFVYDKTSPQEKKYRAVDKMLSPYICGAMSMTRRLVRA